ncbi:Mitotic spindle checkpoint component mad2 [Lobulomyces angularis]|nr:Mitotic spindle checkpoint component mad2 [Lobulomyces angularis]
MLEELQDIPNSIYSKISTNEIYPSPRSTKNKSPKRQFSKNGYFEATLKSLKKPIKLFESVQSINQSKKQTNEKQQQVEKKKMNKIDQVFDNKINNLDVVGFDKIVDNNKNFFFENPQFDLDRWNNVCYKTQREKNRESFNEYETEFKKHRFENYNSENIFARQIKSSLDYLDNFKGESIFDRFQKNEDLIETEYLEDDFKIDVPQNEDQNEEASLMENSEKFMERDHQFENDNIVNIKETPEEFFFHKPDLTKTPKKGIQKNSSLVGDNSLSDQENLDNIMKNSPFKKKTKNPFFFNADVSKNNIKNFEGNNDGVEAILFFNENVLFDDEIEDGKNKGFFKKNEENLDGSRKENTTDNGQSVVGSDNYRFENADIKNSLFDGVGFKSKLVEIENEFTGSEKSCILYQRSIYPNEDFETVKKFNIPLMKTTNDKLLTYFEKLFFQLENWIRAKKISKLVLAISDINTFEVLERWQFDLELVGEKDEKENEDLQFKEKTEGQVSQEISAIIKQITSCNTFLPILDGSQTTFKVLVYTDKDAEVPTMWIDSDAKLITNNAEQVRLRSLNTGYHKVDSMVSYKTMSD